MRNVMLTEPVRGRCGAGGELVSADAPLRRLQLRAGGAEGGIIALPDLLDLCRLSRRLGMKLARSIDVMDGQHDYRLLVETQPDGEELSFRIIAWSERERAQPLVEPEQFTLAAPVEEGEAQLQLDAGLRVIAFDAYGPCEALNSPAIGTPLTDWLSLKAGEGGRFTMLEAVAERQAFKDQAALIGSRAVAFSGQPLLSAYGDFAGYICDISVLPQEQGEALQVSTSFPAQLASPNLKQPLNRIIANAETIHGRLLGPIRENYAGYARDIASAASHLKELVDDFGDLEAIERPGYEPDMERVDCCELARRAAGLLTVRAADHNIALQVPPESESLAAVGEYRRILQILVNLVGNAVRYSPDGTTVRVSTTIGDDHRPAITVADEGGGIDPEDRERIFEKFERLGRTADGGSGLGLYISRRFARAMGGELAIEDGVSVEGAGKGARFVLTLPPA